MSEKFYSKIVMAINGEINSIHGAMYAIMMAKSYNLQLKFVYVIDSATIKYLGNNQVLIKSEQMEYAESLKKEGESFLQYAKELALSKGLEVETEIREGTVFKEIIKCAEEYEADLLILGGREKDPKNRFAKVNVFTARENEMLSNSKCPVLIVQKNNVEQQFREF
ncbi:MAG: universal stress protein [Treponema sp.]|nr:universal stress protein [Treponema sp.]